MIRTNYSSGTHWEETVGYSRAVKIGNIIEVSGTTAMNEMGDIIGLNNVYEQTCFCIQKIETVLKQAGSELSDVIRTRIYVTDISQWEEIAKALASSFGTIKPASTMIQVSALIDHRLLVEIEASAIIIS